MSKTVIPKDYKPRLDVYRTQKAIAFIKKTFQERLSEVNYEIENYSAQLRVLANRVRYSTVTLNIWEVERVTEQEPSLWSRIKNRFLDNLDDLIDGLKNAVVDIVGGLPILLPIAVVAVVAVLIIRKLIKKRKAKRNI